MCIEHACGMFIRQCAHCRIPLCFARRKLVFFRTDFPAKQAGESLHLRRIKHLISLWFQVFLLFICKIPALKLNALGRECFLLLDSLLTGSNNRILDRRSRLYS